MLMIRARFPVEKYNTTHTRLTENQSAFAVRDEWTMKMTTADVAVRTGRTTAVVAVRTAWETAVVVAVRSVRAVA